MSSRLPGNAENRRSNFKFNSITTDELRRRREESQVEIRKNKREDSLNKRRNIVEAAAEAPASAAEPLSGGDRGLAASSASPRREHDMTPSELAQQLPNMVQSLYSPDLASQYASAVAFRKVLAKERNAPIQKVVDCGVIPRFVEILAGQTFAPSDEAGKELLEKTQFEASWVLTNIASGDPEHTMAVVDAHAVPVLISLLMHENGEIREQSIWALGNIAGDGPKLRDYCLQENMMGLLLENVVLALSNVTGGGASAGTPSSSSAMSKDAVRNGAWAISNLCRGTPGPSWMQVVVALPVIHMLLQTNDDDTLVDTCWALAYMTTDGDALDDIIGASIVGLLVPLLAHKNVTIQVPALRAVGNIVTGADHQTQAVIDAGALPLLRALLSHARTSIVKESCWALSNITAGTPAQIQAVMDANIIPPLVHLLTFADYKVKKEACWAICNATTAFESHPHQVKHVVQQGCIKPLCAMLEGSHDGRVILVTLDGLKNILSVGEQESFSSADGANPYAVFIEEVGGLNAICTLQEHPETEVYLKAKSIIDIYFEGEDDDENVFETSEPAASGMFDFGSGSATSVPQGGFTFT